ncbi:helix-turn-helix domain-containing protein [Shimia sp. Alg240-R146]|uniref:helix-turn-helix domain-containing protein n=1 Tax=Shimia sp. Alg240-R146 TaxID=2993449 RepID=UPI0022E3628D|nr:helix-turn-helix transcriptional regulator [Shimia sp. Alg240-R146]
MTTLSIDPQRLKTVRKARKLGRSKLAKMGGITERQLTKLETSKAASLPEPAASRLAAALQIPTQALTGELPLIEDDLQPKSTCTSGCCG